MPALGIGARLCDVVRNMHVVLVLSSINEESGHAPRPEAAGKNMSIVGRITTGRGVGSRGLGSPGTSGTYSP